MADRPTATLETTHCRQFPSLTATQLYYISPGTWFWTSIQPLKHIRRSHGGFSFKFPKTTSSVCQLDGQRVPLFARAQPKSGVRNFSPPNYDTEEYDWSAARLLRKKGCTRFITHGIPLTKNAQGGDSTYSTVLIWHLLGTFLKNFTFVFCKKVRKLYSTPDLKTNLNVWRLSSITWVNIM